MTDFKESFYCCITGELMQDPVMDPDGNTYERSAIEDWIRIKGLSPMTRNPLQIGNLVPNRALQAAIEALAADAVPSRNPDAPAPMDPNEPEPVYPPINLQLEVTALPCQQLDSTLPADEMFVMTNIISPAMSERAPYDIVVCVDVSGSMGAEAQAAGVESSGLSMLDIVKHAVKTIIKSLGENDRVAVVSYSNAASICCDLTNCHSSGRDRAIGEVMSLQVGGMTNLWDGLKTSLDLLTNRGADMAGRNGAVMLLTDGVPNVDPPRGYVPTLQRYKDKAGGKYPGVISTFGFGYNLKSDLLVDIATEGTGTYSFIPDSGFVGTVFVNALANTLTTCADNVSLAIDAEDPTATIHALDGYAVFSKESDRINYSAKTMQIGQSFGSIVRINKSQLPLILAKLTYHSLDSAEDGTTVTVTGPIEEITEEQRQDLALEYFRIETINSIEKAINVSETNNSDRFETAKSAIQDTITKLDRWVSATSDCPGVTVPDSTIPILSARARIIAIGEDLKGQLTEAVSKAEFFMKWGAHFLRSIKRTHMLKQCNNFKDPGVQNYGNVIFQTVRDEADDIFSTLPPPVSSGLRVSAGYGLYRGSGSSSGGGGGYGGGSVSRSAPQSAPAAPPALSMASFNRPDMVCFHDQALVHMDCGATKKACDVTHGDILQDGGHIRCVVRTDSVDNKATLARVVIEGKELLLTPHHPILYKSEWVFPINVGTLVEVTCASVFSYLVENVENVDNANQESNTYSSTMVVNGITCATLAHGVKNVPNLSHDFFGTDAIVKALEKCEGFGDGLVVFKMCDQGKESFLIRDSITNDVCGIALEKEIRV